jgi:hypothetical protein
MEATKSRGGRPATRQRHYPGAYIGFRAPQQLKDALTAAAEAANNSLSTEAQLILRQALHTRGTLAEAAEMAYGQPTAELLAVLGEIMRAADQVARTNETRGWYDHRATLDLVIETVNEIFSRLRRCASDREPVLDPAISKLWVQHPLRALAGEDAERRRERLGAAAEPLVEWSRELRPGAHPSPENPS